MNINIPVPENCEPAMVTVVYRFKPRFVPVDKPLKNSGKSTEKWLCKTCGGPFDSKRSLGQHERYCGKGKKHGFTAAQKQYVREHMDDPAAEVAAHLGLKKGAIFDLRYRMRKGLTPSHPDLELDVSTIQGKQSITVPHPVEPDPPKQSYFDKLKEKFSGFHPPEDFDEHRPFGPKAYVYHAPGREMGRIITVNMEEKTALIEFPEGAKKFTIDAAKSMFNEMLARAK